MSIENIDAYRKYILNHPSLSVDKDRLEALSSFEKLGMPTKSQEDWKYTSTKKLDRFFKTNHINKKVGPFQRSSNEVVIECHNGFFDVETQRATLESLGIAISPITSDIKKRFFKEADPESPSFVHLNKAMFENGIYIKVSSKTLFERPIVLSYFFNDEIEMINPVIIVELEKNAQIKIHEILSPNAQMQFVNSQMFVECAENSRLSFFKMLNLKNNNCYHSYSKFVQKRDSFVEYFNLSTGSDMARDQAIFILGEQNSECQIKGFSSLNGTMQDHFIKVIHDERETQSQQLFKSMLKNKAHYVFQGNITIEQSAQKSNAQQLNNNLLLDKTSHVDTKPQLDVHADDVKATHGATIGQLNSDERFYLLSRAIPPEKVHQLICFGYALDVIESLGDKYAKEKAREFLEAKIKEYL